MSLIFSIYSSSITFLATNGKFSHYAEVRLVLVQNHLGFGGLRPSRFILVPTEAGRVVGLTSSFSDSIVFAVHTRKQRFQTVPFSNRSTLESVFRIDPLSHIVFGVVVWTVIVSGTKQYRFRLKTVLVWTGVWVLKLHMYCTRFFDRVRTPPWSPQYSWKLKTVFKGAWKALEILKLVNAS